MSYLKQFTKILRGSLSTTPTPTPTGPTSAFHLPIRKLVVRYNQHNPSSSGTRAFLLSPRFASLSQSYPTIEFVVDHVGSNKHPLVTGFYAGSRRKDVGLANLDQNQVEAKLRLVVESSGNRVVALKRKPVVSRAESARGVWSQLHDRKINV